MNKIKTNINIAKNIISQYELDTEVYIVDGLDYGSYNVIRDCIYLNEQYHSSEEFNLSCGLRQSISDTFRFSAIFMFPAALLGIPSEIFVIISPIHLFMQFWYHTKLINKMGWLELVIITPSHHRVHHAINKEYLDKNYGQIFIFWDKIFNTFQKELKTVSPVYGILRPAKTWNPIIINFKHLLQLIQDFWHTKNKLDKIIIWFMPTGWRPGDIILKYPIQTISKALELIKYNTKNSKKLIIWSWFQLCISMVIMFYIFIEINNFNIYVLYLHVLFLMLHIFSYTSLLDGSQYVILVETINFIFGIIIINIQKFYYTDFGIIIYLFFSLCFTIYFLKKEKLL